LHPRGRLGECCPFPCFPQPRRHPKLTFVFRFGLGSEDSNFSEIRTVQAKIGIRDEEEFDRTLSVAPASYVDDMSIDVLAGDLADAYAPGGISVDSGSAESRGLSVGDELTVAFPDGEPATLTVRAITQGDSSLEGGNWYVGLDTVRRYVPEEAMPLPLMLFVTAESGLRDEARTALEAALAPYPQMELRDQAEFKELIQGQVGQLLNMVYGLLALAIIVAILGVVNTLALSVIERTREIGLLRAIGLSRPQLRRMIRLESVVIALFGALLGLGLGMAWGAAGQRVRGNEGKNCVF
jgi:putative ABC transport system permease protein